MTNGFFHIAAYHQTGTRHESKGIGCEDSVQVFYSEGAKVAVAALSDGAGSCDMAAEGSKITVETTVAIMSEMFDRLYSMPESEAADFILSHIRKRMHSVAQKQGISDIIRYSATLLCAVLADDGRYMYFHVGDGIIAACNQFGNCRIVSAYVHDIAPNYTTFVTLEDTDYHFHRGKDDISEFLLMSDGPEQFLKYGDVLTRKGDLLASLSYFYSGDAIIREMEDLTSELQQNGMTDDASFAVIADKRKAGDVFFHMDCDTMKALFRMQNLPLTKERRGNIRDMLNLLASQESASEKHLGKNIYMHNCSEKVFSRLESFVECGVIRFLDNNHYQFP